jgi:hypothetical protein
MKAIALMLVLSTFVSRGADDATNDVRIVEGKRVDLGPLLEWISKEPKARKGIRPMPHWKIVTMLESRGQMGAWGTRVLMKIEGEPQEQEVVVQLANKHVLMLLETERTSRERALQSKGEARAARSAADVWDLESTRRLSSSFSADYYLDASYRLRQARIWERQAEEAAQADEVIAEHAKKAKLDFADLAMFTGKKVGGIEVWTFGQRSK